MPRPESWPLSRTGVPSSTSVPKASASPKAQSMVPPLAITSRRFSTKPRSLGCRWKFSGKCVMPRITRSSTCWLTAVRGQIAADLLVRDRAQFLQFVALGVLLRRVVGVGEARGEFLAHRLALLRR